MEALERRALFTVNLANAAGVLNVVESTAGTVNNVIVSVNANAGSLTVSDSSDTLALSGLQSAGWVLSTDAHVATGPETGINSLLIDTRDGNDTIEIISCDLPILVQPSGAADENLVIGGNTTAAGVTGRVTYNATNASSAVLTIADRMDPNHADITVASTYVFGASPAEIDFTAPQPSTAFNPFNINIQTPAGGSAPVVQEDPLNSTALNLSFLSSGVDNISIQQLNAASNVSTYAYTGATDNVVISKLHSISEVQGHVFVDGGVGSANITIDDSAGTSQEAFSIAPDQRTMEVRVNDNDLVGFEVAAVTGLTIMTGNGDDSGNNTVDANLTNNFPAGFVTTVDVGAHLTDVSVTGLSAIATLDVNGTGSGGADLIVTQPNVLGAINLNGSDHGGAVLRVDASAVTTNSVITISSSQVTGFSAAPINFTNVGLLTVIGGSGTDDFTVTPSPTTQVDVDGGPSSARPSDVLVVNTSATPQLTLSTDNTGEFGNYTFTDGSRIKFEDFGSIAPTFGVVTGTLFNQQNGLPVPNITVALDLNGNGQIDPSDPKATTDANGGFPIGSVPAGNYSLLIDSAAYVLASPIAVSVVATTLNTPIDVPVVPLSSDAGPDLTATVVTVPGKGAASNPKVKVKITNVGSAMTSAASVQIVLRASTTQLPSAGDLILSTATVPLKLNARASKTLTLVGSTNSSLTAGQYYILASVDSANAVAETNESNNIAAPARPVALAPAAIDLTGRFGAVPRSAAKAKLLSLPLSLQNIGTIAAAGGSSVAFYASTDRTFDDSDIELGTGFPVSVHLAVGKTQNLKFRVSLAAVPAGSYYLFARINPAHSVAESSYANNDIFSGAPITVA